MRVVAIKARRITGEGQTTVILKGDSGVIVAMTADNRGPTLTVDWDHAMTSGVTDFVTGCREAGVDPRHVRLVRREDL